MTAAQHGQQQTALGSNQEVQDYLSTRILVREARKVVADLNLDIDGSRLRGLVREYKIRGQGDQDLRTWLTAYADPTGNAAAAELDRQNWAIKARSRKRKPGRASQHQP